MVKNREQQDPSGSHRVQDVGVRKVRTARNVPLPTPSRGRLLSLAAMRVHNVHIQAGRRTRGCLICGQDMEGLFQEVETPGGAVRVVEGGGADASGAAAPASGDGTSDGEDPVLRKEEAW